MTRANLPSLVALYPKAWRRRYGTEFTDLLTDLAGERSGTGRLLLVAVGVLSRRRRDTLYAGAVGGTAAGLVMAVAVFITSLVLDIAFFNTISQQHDKRVAFAFRTGREAPSRSCAGHEVRVTPALWAVSGE